MIINTPISLGELIDKISILLIKERKITDVKKIDLIHEELTLLKKTLNEVTKDSAINDYLNQLLDINSADPAVSACILAISLLLLINSEHCDKA